MRDITPSDHPAKLTELIFLPAQSAPHFQAKIAHYPSSPRLIEQGVGSTQGSVAAEGVDAAAAAAPPPGLGVGEHTDSGLLTLIACSSESTGTAAAGLATKGGLQALAPDGKTWLDVEPERDSLILNFGEVLEMATGGLVKAVSFVSASIQYSFEDKRTQTNRDAAPLASFLPAHARRLKTDAASRVERWLIAVVSAVLFQPDADVEAARGGKQRGGIVIVGIGAKQRAAPNLWNERAKVARAIAPCRDAEMAP